MAILEKHPVRIRSERGNRWKLFLAVDAARAPRKVLYPACAYDVSPSLVFPDITYADGSDGVAAFFDDIEGVLDIVAGCSTAPQDAAFRFIHADCTKLSLPLGRFDLVISLGNRPVAESCARFLKTGGWFLTRPQSQDAAALALDPSFGLAAVVRPLPGHFDLEMIDPAPAGAVAPRSGLSPGVPAQGPRDRVPEPAALVYARIA